MPRPTLLLVEDDANLAEMLTWHFEREDFDVRWVSDGDRALQKARDEQPQLILLDWNLPGLSGIEICRRLRDDKITQTSPIIFLSARGEEADRVQGLDAGADDYVTKPFSPRELIARCKAVLRRGKGETTTRALKYADLHMDVENFKVKRGDKTLHLGPREFQLLRHFMENPGRVYSRERLLTAVWGGKDNAQARAVDVHIRRLRIILNEGGGPDLIRTVRSGGYSLDAEF